MENDGHCYCEVVKPHRHVYWKNVCVDYKQHCVVWLHSEGGRDNRLTANIGPWLVQYMGAGCSVWFTTQSCIEETCTRGHVPTHSSSTPVVTCPPTPECTCLPTPPLVTVHLLSLAPLWLNVPHCLVLLRYQPLHHLHLVR